MNLRVFRYCLLFYFMYGILYANTVQYKRIITTSLEATDIFYKLGQPYFSYLLGVPYTIDSKEYSILTVDKKIVRVRAEIEQVLNLNPDYLILLDYHSNNFYQALKQYKIPFIILESSTGFLSHIHNIKAISKLLGCDLLGDKQILNFNQKIETLKNNPFSRQIRNKKLRIISFTGNYVAGNRTTFDDVVSTLGFINIASQNGISGYQRIDWEVFIKWSPEFVIVPCSTKNLCEKAKESFLYEIQNRNLKITPKIIPIPEALMSSVDDGMILFGEAIIEALSN